MNYVEIIIGMKLGTSALRDYMRVNCSKGN